MLKLQMERDESEETVAHYTMGAGLEAMRRDSASSFYHYNHLGTALALTSADEAVSDTYRHDAWGVLLERTGSTLNPHTYVGRERYYRMPNAAMYHLGFRDYAQGVGRFTTVDPLREGTNSFRYAANSPSSTIDPDGRQLMRIPTPRDYVEREYWGLVDEILRRWRESGYAEMAPYYLCWSSCMLTGITFRPGDRLQWDPTEVVDWLLGPDRPREFFSFKTLLYYHKYWRCDRRFKHGRYSKMIKRALPGLMRGIGKGLLFWDAINSWLCLRDCSDWLYLADPWEEFRHLGHPTVPEGEP